MQNCTKIQPVVLTRFLMRPCVAVMSRKDELADQVGHLKALLEKESERNSSLTNELTEVRKKSAETNDKAQARIQTLTRENDLLKHQLKKYVSAVMKLRDGPQVNISISILMDEVYNIGLMIK